MISGPQVVSMIGTRGDLWAPSLRDVASLRLKGGALAGSAPDQFDPPSGTADTRHGQRCGG
jgi:hypothetical protein